jgi:uncharacterized repeat protein (TIGR01451 family)
MPNAALRDTVFVLAAALWACSPASASALNDTGQVDCYDASATSTGTVSGAAPSPEAPGFEAQDCSLGASAADAVGVQVKLGGSSVKGRDYTKISSSGAELPPSAVIGSGPNDWRCTRDNVTGLIWLIGDGDGSGAPRYAYGNSPNIEGDTCGGTVTPCNTAQVLALINQFSVCGGNDWTIPTPAQFESLMAYDNPGDPNDPGNLPNFIDRTWFPDQTNGGVNQFVFWTQAAADTLDPPSQWVADFSFGFMTLAATNSPAYLRLVRQAPAPTTPRFSTSAPGSAGEIVVTDAHTGLMWKQCPQGLAGAACASGTLTSLDWSGALVAAGSESFAGFSDWRLPNIIELASIREYNTAAFGTPALPAAFPGDAAALSQSLWSSTNVPVPTSLAAAMSYQFTGAAAHLFLFKNEQQAVRLVRAGEFLATHAPGGDSAPNAFSFASGSGPVGSLVESVPITIAGLNGPASLKVSGAAQSAYSINGGPWRSLAGAVRNGDSLRLRHQAGAAFGATVTTTLNIGGVSAGFTSTASASAPSAPSNVVAVRGNASASLSFTAPASNGGSAITAYTAISSPAGGTSSCQTPPATACTVSGLINGQSYTFTVTATNSAGTSTPSLASNAITPATVPGAPTSVSATAGIAQATVSFVAPASNGGAAISGYTATSSPQGRTGTCSSSPCTVTGLDNGQSYSFSVTATNSVGTGAASTASSSITTPAVPGAPSAVVAAATGTNGQASVSFSAPASTGGSAILDYTATSSPGGLSATCASSPCTVSGLSSATAYTFAVRARNAVGLGPASTASNSLVLNARPTIAFEPAARTVFPMNHNGGFFILLNANVPDHTLRITDSDTPLSQLTVSVSSSNTALLPSGPDAQADGIYLARLPNDQGLWRATFRPKPNQAGSANLTFTVTDNTGLAASVQATVNFTSENREPKSTLGLRTVRLPANAPAGAYAVPNFLVSATPGEGEEQSQGILHEIMFADDGVDFSASFAPTLDLQGTLRFTLPVGSDLDVFAYWPTDTGPGDRTRCSGNRRFDYLREELAAYWAEIAAWQGGAPVPKRSGPCGRLSPMYLLEFGKTAVDMGVERSAVRLARSAAKGLPAPEITYTVRVTNVGGTDITDARLQVPVPAQLGAVNWTCTINALPCGVASGAGAVSIPLDLLMDDVAEVELTGSLNATATFVTLTPTLQLAPGVEGLVLANGVERIDILTNAHVFRGSFEGAPIPLD